MPSPFLYASQIYFAPEVQWVVFIPNSADCLGLMPNYECSLDLRIFTNVLDGTPLLLRQSGDKVDGVGLQHSEWDGDDDEVALIHRGPCSGRTKLSDSTSSARPGLPAHPRQ